MDFKIKNRDIDCKMCRCTFTKDSKPPKYIEEFKKEVVMMYINSMGIRAIARVKKIHNSVVSLWIRQMGEKVKKEFENQLKKIQPKEIPVIELDELFTYVKKSKKIYIFTAVDRNNLRTIAIKISHDRSENSFLEFSSHLKQYDIKISCSDDCSMYKSCNIANKHITSKSETALVEAKNSSLRDNLARLNRRTKKYSKCPKMLEFSVYILIFYKTFNYLINCW